MEVILIKDVAHLGAANEVVTVKGGYARNFLIPSALAVEASDVNRKVLKDRLRMLAIKENKQLAAINAIIAKFEESVLKIPVKVSAHGSIFGSITNILIAREMKNQWDLQIDRKKIVIPEHITNTGVYEATVNFSAQQKATFSFELISDGSIEG